MTEQSVEPTGFNLVVLRGVLSSNPAPRTLPSGDLLTSYEVTIRDAERPAESVPVVLVGGGGPRGIGPGDEVVVVGRVRRRFFRAGGATASRTEVVASRVMRASRRAAVGAVFDDVARRLVSDAAEPADA
jgi:single-strand DNA-binding protein